MWGFWLTLAGGPVWGPAAGAATGTGAGAGTGGSGATPWGLFVMNLAVSFHFVYVGGGLS